MPSASFTAVIKIRGINPFVLVSASRAKTIKPGWRKPLPVLPSEFPLEQYAAALNLFVDRQAVQKIVLRVPR
jgi:hypothetical protein